MAINLEKGQRISLEKDGAELSEVSLGLGWGRRTKKGFFGTSEVDVDLDASCLLFDAQGQLQDQVWFRQLKSRCGSVRHTGDDRSGGGGGENERIELSLDAVPTEIRSLVFTVNSFLNDSFAGIPSAFCRLVNKATGQEIARYDISLDGGDYTGLLLAVIYRHEGKWKMRAVGEKGHGRTFQELMPLIAANLP
ncbi:TerD family protein [Thiococcus pfennigii]|jgi:tellurium resistance protein TerZ|uniref:TerD family protein n=1 Tax=Thiococcus pfennigii TaxID=1057 RepID=UPI0019088C5D|nr:TerD family protein [Thiococcus pfennigii]MBK1702364.1 Tellurium resistance protein terZ [Thiococcus pfennigii]MBK1733144.1 Tellurium resistance protein terZ [Thiococcus pfennigii]